MKLSLWNRIRFIRGTLPKVIQAEAIERGLRKRAASAHMKSRKFGNRSESETNVAGDIGEACTCHGLEIQWEERLNVFKSIADAGTNLDLRTGIIDRPDWTPALCIGRPGDILEGKLCILTWIYGSRGPKFAIVGWCYGEEASDLGKWCMPNGRLPYCWEIQHYKLRPIMQLFYMVHPELTTPVEEQEAWDPVTGHRLRPVFKVLSEYDKPHI